MAVQNVTIFTCDMCKTTTQRDMKEDNGGKLDEAITPLFWSEVKTTSYYSHGPTTADWLLCDRCTILMDTFFSQLPTTRRLEDAEVAAPRLSLLADTDYSNLPMSPKPVPPYVPRKG